MPFHLSKSITAFGLLLAGASARGQQFDPTPWLADARQAKQAFATKYANLEWLENEREIKLDSLFDDLDARMRSAHSQEEAKAVFDRMVRKIADGHVEIAWPSLGPTAPLKSESAAPPASSDRCAAIGFDARQNGPGTAFALPGYASLPDIDTNPFAAGTTIVGGTKVGVIRIGVFQPQGFPDFCRAALEAEQIPSDRLCDDSCQDQIESWAYPRLTAAIEDRARQLKVGGAAVLLIDITGNGGGSQWAEAVARIFSAKRIISERRGMVRGEHWARQWRDIAQQLRAFAANADAPDKARLLEWAARADYKMRDAETPCVNGSCKRIADAGYSAGLVGSAAAGSFAGKQWGPLVFSPAAYPYHVGVWTGPLIVLVDDATGSAAEEFAAVLQDNKAAIVVGARTAGAGCGHTRTEAIRRCLRTAAPCLSYPTAFATGETARTKSVASFQTCPYPFDITMALTFAPSC